MKIELFQKAKQIQESISHLNVKKTQIECTKDRTGDEEFNTMRQLAHDSICYSIQRLNDDFEKL